MCVDLRVLVLFISLLLGNIVESHKSAAAGDVGSPVALDHGVQSSSLLLGFLELVRCQLCNVSDVLGSSRCMLGKEWRCG